ncbi:hypothetical protein [Telmatospirillum sp. J64-1]|uniref:type III secretion apparatus assembly protein SctX n=1 Tax=Telmatospirillum sp. J64-1 TaxID=2502183 RepID=UPI00115F7651|nr:hypothetical protein [Telmatospirillum sp. J64-1]
MDFNIKGFSFDRGIDRIISAQDQPENRLPSEGRLAPSDSRAIPRLDQILHTETVGGALLRDLAPKLSQNDMLMPDRFHRALGEALDMINQQAGAHPEHDSLFKEAASVLREEQELRELLDLYRNALFKG